MTYHHPSENIPEPDNGFTEPWHPFVDAVMSFCEEAKAMEATAKEGGAATFGQDLHDFVDGQRLDYPEKVAEFVFTKDPRSWATLLRASLIMVQGAEDERQLVERLKHLGGLTTQWIADVQRRSMSGVQL